MLQTALGSNLRPHVKKYLENVVALSESGGPLLSASLFAYSYRLQAPYPMDATFFFNFCALLGIGL